VSESGASKRTFIQPDLLSESRQQTSGISGDGPASAVWYLVLFGLLRNIPSAPSWLVSLTVHCGLLLLLALLPLRDSGPTAELLIFGDSAGDSAALYGGEVSLLAEASDSLFSTNDIPQSETLFEFSENASLLLVETLQSDFRIPSTAGPTKIASLLSGRSEESRAELLRRGGGTAQTESAVQLGLEWLARQQRPDGGWSLKGQYADPAATENRTAATAMALNAFLGAGFTHQGQEYASQVKRGLEFLIKRQAENGFFALDEPAMQQAYAQAIATLTVLESYGLTGDAWLHEPARRAVGYAMWAQSDLGGWRYQPREDADTSVTGWFVMALKTAEQVGFEVDNSYAVNVNRFLDSVSHRSDSAYSYDTRTPPDLTMTAEGILCRILLGWPRDHPPLKRAIEELVTNVPHQSDPLQSVYFWYYATQALHHYGGTAWKTWNDRMKRALPTAQEQQGPDRGSWSPAKDAYGTAGGRLYTTCLNIYCLEVYYRHLAIYDTTHHDLP
jgi:hypothetical protein